MSKDVPVDPIHSSDESEAEPKAELINEERVSEEEMDDEQLYEPDVDHFADIDSSFDEDAEPVLLEVRGNDGQIFRADARALKLSDFLGEMIRNLGYDVDDGKVKHPLTVGTITGPTLRMILDWCEHHKADRRMPVFPQTEDGKFILPEWDAEFFGRLLAMEQLSLTDAAKDLSIVFLLETIAKVNANMGCRDSPDGLEEELELNGL